MTLRGVSSDQEIRTIVSYRHVHNISGFEL